MDTYMRSSILDVAVLETPLVISPLLGHSLAKKAEARFGLIFALMKKLSDVPADGTCGRR